MIAYMAAATLQLDFLITFEFIWRFFINEPIILTKLQIKCSSDLLVICQCENGI